MGISCAPAEQADKRPTDGGGGNKFRALKLCGNKWLQETSGLPAKLGSEERDHGSPPAPVGESGTTPAVSAFCFPFNVTISLLLDQHSLSPEIGGSALQTQDTRQGLNALLRLIFNQEG